MRWLMNMPVDPSNPAKVEQWEAWVRSRHPGATDEEMREYFAEWSRLLSGKVVGQPWEGAKPAAEYAAMGWVGLYQLDPGKIQIEGKDYVLERGSKQIHETLKVKPDGI